MATIEKPSGYNINEVKETFHQLIKDNIMKI